MPKDHGLLKSKYIIRKFNTKESRENHEPDTVSEFEKNMFLVEGIEKLWKLVANIDTSSYFAEANTYIGVGNGTTAEAEGQTGLQGGSTAFASMDSGYPQVSGDTITFYATFDRSTANFDWEEFTIVNSGDDTGDNLNRKVSGQGTKVNGAVWEFEVQLQITHS